MRKQTIGHTKHPLPKTYSRRPGQSLDEMIGILRGKLLIWTIMIAMVLLVMLVEWMYYFVNMPLQPLYATILAGFIIVFSLWKMNKIQRELKNYILGREGEREVGEKLENIIRLTGCYIYHDLIGTHKNGRKFNIDHVIISDRGIYVVETKTRTKHNEERHISFDGESVKLEGHSPDSGPIEEARYHARWLREEIYRLTNGKIFEVIGIVVYPGWVIDKTQIRNSKDVWVSNPIYLQYVFKDLIPVLTSDDIKLLNDVINPLVQSPRDLPC